MITVGKHAAPEGSAVHPLVARALARRTDEAAEGQPPDERTGPVGWPAPPVPGGGGLGWPGREPEGAAAPPAAEVPAADPPVVVQRGWRRLFRQRPAA
jgi:hypothetical protein